MNRGRPYSLLLLDIHYNITLFNWQEAKFGSETRLSLPPPPGTGPGHAPENPGCRPPTLQRTRLRGDHPVGNRSCVSNPCALKNMMRSRLLMIRSPNNGRC